jgi:hypothetical protein
MVGVWANPIVRNPPRIDNSAMSRGIRLNLKGRFSSCFVDSKWL